jgi:hypothetical protein
MKTYKFLLTDGNIAKVTADINVYSNGRYYVWSCDNYIEETPEGSVYYNSMGPISASRCARYIKGAKLI